MPPRSEAVIPARVHGSADPGAIGSVKSEPRLAESYFLQGATSLVTLSQVNTIPLILRQSSSLYTKEQRWGHLQKLARTLICNLLAR